MDIIIGIFTSLGVDETIFTQFAIVIVIYFILKYTFFTKLQFVIEMRIAKTTGLETDANKKFAEADEIADKYRNEIEITQAEGQKVFSERKSQIISKERDRYKKHESEVLAEAEKTRSENLKFIDQHRELVFSKKKNLGDELVSKISN